MAVIENLLEYISEKELAVMIKHYCDYLILVKPIKENSRKYSKYTALLGSYKRTSALVQKNLPRIAAELYRKWDTNYTEYIGSTIDDEVMRFMNGLEKYTDKTDYTEITEEEYKKIIDDWKNDPDAEQFIDETFIPNLKLCYAIDTADKEQYISTLLFGVDDDDALEGGVEYDTKNEEEIDSEELIESEETQVLVNVNKKPRKKTAQEKAESTRLANERKRKEQLEEENRKKQEAQDIAEEIVELSKDALIKELNAAPEPEEKEEKNNIVETFTDKTNTYLGMIDIRSTFYNFAPLGEWNGRSFTQFSLRDVERLIPQSVFHNINLYYNISDPLIVRQMKESFCQEQICVLEFETDELQENRDYTGRLNNTGYKAPATDFLRAGKLRPISSEGLYRVINLESFEGDIHTSKIVDVRAEGIVEDEEILVNMRNGFYAGPYKVKFSPTRNKFFIKPQGDDQNYLVSGYNVSDCVKHTIESVEEDQWSDNHKTWALYSIKPGAETVVNDVITDRQLLESVQAYFSTQEGNAGDINSLINNSDSFSLVDESVPESIRQNRLNRLKTLLKTNEKLTENLDQISSLLADMILRDKDGVVSSEIIDKIIETRPDFLNKIPSMRIMQERIEGRSEELQNLELKRSQIEQELENFRQEESEKTKERITSTQKELAEAESQLKKVTDELELVSDLSNRAQKKQELEGQVGYLEEHKARLERDSKILESKFVDLINQYTNKIVDITFDGYISSKMIQSASEWERQGEEKNLYEVVERINAIDAEDMMPEELVDYVVTTINKVRPQYSKNMIINLLICTVQGFITVFYGTPGCGKTSICNILSKVLGLSKYEAECAENPSGIGINRYIPVSVERGWTSKRDFVGYYNPLTKTFEDSNREVFDGLRILDAEARKNYSKYPFVILLDEANLSPMEYYWADFMNVCDDINDNNRINIGNGNSFIIPDTLHFVATINNDHTTETLSPRLVDRAWVISLPKLSVMNYTQQLTDSELRIVSWKSLKNAFLVPQGEDIAFDSEIQRVYEELKRILGKVDITISPRIDIAIHKYWYAASKRMEKDEYNNSPGMIAFDYVVAQKILPKINGSGEEFREWLNTLSQFCSNYNLMISMDIVHSIIAQGDRQLNYYQFFN